MNRIILHVVIATLSFIVHHRSLAANWASEYWIADRGDGAGDGSLANPYDGRGADNFDLAMNNIQQLNSVPSVIHILPGTYQTHGYKQYTPPYKGFAIHNGWTIQGSGVDKTIIQLIDANADSGTNSSGFNVVIYTGDTGAYSNMSVLDLTIDCNYSGVAANTGLTNLTLGAVNLLGHNNRIERVKAINAVGKRYPNPEVFILTVGQIQTAAYPATGLLIRDCEVSSFAGGNCAAITASGYGGSTGSRGIIQNNRVHLDAAGGEEYAYGVGTPGGFIVENNISWNATRGYNHDSGYGTNLVIRGNLFLESAFWGAALFAGTNSVFENNVIETIGTNSCALIMSSPSSSLPPGAGGWTIRNNIFRNKSGGTNNGGIGFWDNITPPNCIFENNRIDSTYWNNSLGSGTGFWFNNTDLAGNNPNGFTMQTARNVVANKP